MKPKYLLLFVIYLQISCQKFVEIDPPKDSLIQSTVFVSDAMAYSAITGIYSRMASAGYASGGDASISILCGLSSDEFNNYAAMTTEFYENQLTSINNNIVVLYSDPYKYIFTANSILEGLETSNLISTSAKSQVKGEALFIRAFNYFYLVNLFGSVPLQLVTDYNITRATKQVTINEIYEQIIKDLKSAEELLKDNYVTSERVRPNVSAVRALLARVYLFQQNWVEAEKYSSLVISKSDTYSLVKLEDVFLKNSNEAIWQLYPMVRTTTINTAEGNLFILIATPTRVSLNSNFILNAFETNDKRKTSWVNSYTNNTGTYNYPFKYKVRASTTSLTEYSMVLRLAEQYLIRAEARAQQNNIVGAIDDLDRIRSRAGLLLIKDKNPGLNKVDLLNAILKERRVELFSEWGHRWFDLKRTSQATLTLSPIKSKWQITDTLYPIPQIELNNNSNINQNIGY